MLLLARLTGVGVGDLVGLVGIQPDLLLAAAQDAGGQPLLEPEHAAEHTAVPLTRCACIRTNATRGSRVHVCVGLRANCFIRVRLRPLHSL